MAALSAIVLDFDGVIADCRRGTLLPGAAEFVRSAARVVPLAIASGATTRQIVELLDSEDLTGCFAAIIGVDQTLRTKPSPDPFLEAMHRMTGEAGAIEASHSVGIDDSVAGLIAARTAGLHCVGIADAARASDLAPHAELIVAGLHTLSLDMLDTLVRGTHPSSRRHVRYP